MRKAVILDFQYGRHVKSISVNISAWKALRRSILVSKYTFSESRNALESLKIALDDYLFRDQINTLILYRDQINILIVMWNKLHTDLKNSTSVNMFKKRYKTFLVSEYA